MNTPDEILEFMSTLRITTQNEKVYQLQMSEFYDFKQINDLDIFIGKNEFFKDLELKDDSVYLQCTGYNHHVGSKKHFYLNVEDSKKDKYSMEDKLTKILLICRDALINKRKIYITCNTGLNESIAISISIITLFFDNCFLYF
jgi:hypothetical protein